MSIWTNVNGVWRKIFNAHVKVNNRWYDTDISNKINGVWRSSHKHYVEPDDILYFKLIYRLNRDAVHPLLPDLKYNPRVPYVLDVSGSYNNKIPSKTRKGVVFEYKREREQEEGVILYQGHLYAVLADDVHINISKTKENKPLLIDNAFLMIDRDRFEWFGGSANITVQHEYGLTYMKYIDKSLKIDFDPNPLTFVGGKTKATVEYMGEYVHSREEDDRLSEIGWSSNKLDKLGTIELLCSHRIEAFGYNLNGWNSLFDTRHLVNERGFTDDEQFHLYEVGDPSLLHKIVFPLNQRDPEFFNQYCEIGIARDLHSKEYHMIGAHGVISHDVNYIRLDGKEYDFSIEIYDY